MSSQYAFILGHVSVLSSIEAKVLIPDLVPESVGEGVMIAQSDLCEPKETMRSSGGLVKIAREYAQSSETDLVGIIVAAIQERVPSGKITFGISLYGETAIPMVGVRLIAPLPAMEVKKILKKAGRSVRHVYSKERALNSATLLFNEFGKPGHVEVCLIPEVSLRATAGSEAISSGAQNGIASSAKLPRNDKNNYIGIFITEAFQDLGEYTELEKLLGARDDRSGVLPLRLVKMLLNIAEVQNGHVLLDPFCGSGILVGVAAHRGVKSIIASDIFSKAVQDTRKNLKNVIARLPKQSSNTSIKLDIEQRDVRGLSKIIEPASVDRIVTEPYLGPSNRAANQKEREELSKLYIDSFREFKKVLKPVGKIVFIFPVFEGVQDFAQVQQEISQMGFAKVDLMKDLRQFFPGVPEPVYSRPQQRVKRLITVWTFPSS